MLLKFFQITLITLLTISCASRSSLPKSASEVNFDSKEGKIGWSEYGQNETFNNTDSKTIYQAAKAGLAAGGFNLVEGDSEKQTLIGEHGITAHDWNVLAGVYYKQIDADVLVRVIVHGSKDVGFNGDSTGDAWAGKIMNGMRTYLSQKKK